jgi:hypothetical protein
VYCHLSCKGLYYHRSCKGVYCHLSCKGVYYHLSCKLGPCLHGGRMKKARRPNGEGKGAE